MKIHCYFLLIIKHGGSQLYWGRPPNTTMRPPGGGGIGVGDGGRGARAPIKFFSGNYYVKFGHFWCKNHVKFENVVNVSGKCQKFGYLI